MKNGCTAGRVAFVALMLLTCRSVVAAEAAATTVNIDAASDRHAIDPRIYGVAFATEAQLSELNVPLNRWGGNTTSSYNWQLDCDNRGADWFFQSIESSKGPLVPGAAADAFIANTLKGGATPMMTVPMLDWVAKLGPDREQKLWSFSRAKYGDQQRYDQWNHDSGNGMKPDGKAPVTGNNPADANVPNSVALQRGWVKHLLKRWGAPRPGHEHYYLLDNESSLWNSTHRDVHPQPLTMDEFRDKAVAYATMIKTADPHALVVGPEEWGWPNYFYSAADAAWRGKHNYRQDSPDRAAHGGQDYLPFLLSELKRAGEAQHRRLIDVLSIHYYPQGGEYGNDTSPAMQARRNRSTRSLWDPKYKDETWINDRIHLIPRLKAWAAAYPGTLTGITEYSWGAENHINGATAQADVLGIFGREGLDLAARWTTPATKSPCFLAIKLYRNYDGRRSVFGDQSVRATVEQPDRLAAFAAVRKSDRALTIMVINKTSDQTPVSLALAHFTAVAKADLWQLSANSIDHLSSIPIANGKASLTVPGPSITLVVVPAK